MNNSMKSLCLAAAVAGLLGGASTLAHAQPISCTFHGANLSISNAVAGASSFGQDPQKPKHSCKGKNDCKGQGADGKNSCKGKGSCATDGSKPPMPKM